MRLLRRGRRSPSRAEYRAQRAHKRGPSRGCRSDAAASLLARAGEGPERRTRPSGVDCVSSKLAGLVCAALLRANLGWRRQCVQCASRVCFAWQAVPRFRCPPSGFEAGSRRGCGAGGACGCGAGVCRIRRQRFPGPPPPPHAARKPARASSRRTARVTTWNPFGLHDEMVFNFKSRILIFTSKVKFKYFIRTHTFFLFLLLLSSNKLSFKKNERVSVGFLRRGCLRKMFFSKVDCFLFLCNIVSSFKVISKKIKRRNRNE